MLIDSSKADESLQKTDSKLKTFGDKLSSGIKTAAKWGAAVGAAGIAAGAGLFKIASDASDALDRIDKLSQKIGLSREAFQEWEYVLSQSGTDVEKLQVGLKTMVQRMDETVQGTGQGARMFEQLGVAVVDATGKMRTQDEAFEDTVRALQRMPEGAEKSRLAFELFGKAGMELMPLLNDTNASLDEMQQATKDLGIIMSDDAVNAGVEFNDRMDDLKRSLTAIKTNIGAELLPMFIKLATWIVDHMPEIQVVISTVVKGISSSVKLLGGLFSEFLLPVFMSIFRWTKNNWPIIQNIITDVFDAVSLAWEKVLKPTLNAIGSVFNGLVDTISTFVSWIQKATDKWREFKSTATDKKDKVVSFVQGLAGSHQSGLSYVPYDGYVAELHKGERVLTADEAYNLDRSDSKQTHQYVLNLTLRTEAREIAKEVYEFIEERNQLLGVNLVREG